MTAERANCPKEIEKVVLRREESGYPSHFKGCILETFGLFGVKCLT